MVRAGASVGAADGRASLSPPSAEPSALMPQPAVIAASAPSPPHRRVGTAPRRAAAAVQRATLPRNRR
jgi:hypothetical protein